MKKFEKKARFGGADIVPLSKSFEHNIMLVEMAQHILDCHAEIDRQSKTINRQSRRLEKRSLILKAAQITSDVNERAIRSAESALHEKDEQIKEYGLFRSDLLNVVGSYDEDLNLFSTDMEIVDAIKKMVAQLPAERVWISSETHSNFIIDGVYLWRWKGKGVSGAGIFNTFNGLLRDKEYTLILAESDFPVPPKPELEVRVGKYEFQDNGHFVTLDVLAIRTYSNGLERAIYCYPDDLRSSKDLFDCGVEELQKRLTNTNARFIGGGDNEQ